MASQGASQGVDAATISGSGVGSLPLTEDDDIHKARREAAELPCPVCSIFGVTECGDESLALVRQRRPQRAPVRQH